MDSKEKMLFDQYKIPMSLQSNIMSAEEAKEKGWLSEDTLQSCKIENIVSFDLVLSTGMTSDYIEKRELTDMISLRELIQNAFDETELESGQPEADISLDSDGTWLKDNGKGVTVESFQLGMSNKVPWMRGYYGEGMKIASFYFSLHQKPVYIFSHNQVFCFLPLQFSQKKQSNLYVLIGKTTQNIQGTHIFIRNFFPNKEKIQRITSVWNEDLQGKLIAEDWSASRDTEKKMPSRIYDYPDQLYIRNMYIGPMSEVAKRESLLSYDLWWFRLDISRKIMTHSVPLLFKEISSILDRSPSCRKVYVNKLVESKMLLKRPYKNSEIVEFNPIFATVEGHLFVYACPIGIIDDFIHALGLDDKAHLLRRIDHYEEIDEVVGRGFIPFYFHYELDEGLKKVPKMDNR